MMRVASSARRSAARVTRIFPYHVVADGPQSRRKFDWGGASPPWAVVSNAELPKRVREARVRGHPSNSAALPGRAPEPARLRGSDI